MLMDSIVRVTAIVSTYCGARFIRGCLEDLVAQTLFARGELGIVVVDAASPQNEAGIVEEFAERYPRQVRYVRAPERETLYAAWNRAIALLGQGGGAGRYLTNANVDDRHDPRCLEVLAAALDADTGAAAAYADSDVTADENAAFAQARRTRRLAWPEFERDTLFETCFLGPHPMWRRSLHGRYGLFDAGLRSAGDYEFWLRLAAAGERFVHVPEPLSLYLENPGSISLANVDLTWQESETARDRYWRAEWGVAPKFRRARPHFERLARRIATLPAGARIALYGAGKHTQRMLPLFRQAVADRGQLVGILEDNPGNRTELAGLPIVATAQWRDLAPAVVIPSSDTYEAQMVARLRGIVDVPVWPVYA
jgi:glycosyltransferase involved in cell wall biosynthesis